MRILFVGDRRSKTAIRHGWSWGNWVLCAKTLYNALEPLGLVPYRDYRILNAYRDDGTPWLTHMAQARLLQSKGWLVVGMGRTAQRALRAARIPHRDMIHPAARGKIRQREAYQAHVREVVTNAGPP